MNLHHIQSNQSGTISSINFGDNPGLILWDMGFVPGKEITVAERTPLNDAVKLLINGNTLHQCNNKADHIRLTIAATGGIR